MSARIKAEGSCLIGFAGGFIGNESGIEVDIQDVACFRIVNGFWTFQNRHTHINAIAVEDTCKGLATTQPTPAYLIEMGACSREEPQPKFFPATMISPGFIFFIKSLSKSSIQMLGKVFGVMGIHIASRDNDIGIDVSPYFQTLPDISIP